MEKSIELIDRSQCTGCGACVDICPTKSISFSLSGLHYYPSINSDFCIKCGKCINRCPPLQMKTRHGLDHPFEPVYYCAWNEDIQERFNATSGGISGALASQAISEGWYVCGAAFDENWKLHHIISNDTSIIDKIRGSKYLQSNMEGIYAKIGDLLKRGEKVLFFGTPCQADALRNSVPVKYGSGLLTCEIICHGVNSPLVWDDYRNYLEKRYSSSLMTYNFRSKCKGWGKLFASYSFKNGTRRNEPGYKNIFHSWFGLHYMMRESCFHCIYRITNRYSDIVIGDFWGIETIEPSLSLEAGVSVLIENSDKAKALLDKTKLCLKKIESNKAQLVMKGFVDKTPEDVKLQQIVRMKQFETDYKSHSFKAMATALYAPITFFRRYFDSLLFHLHITK